MKKLLLLALIALLAIAVVSAQDWPMVNYDNAMSRHSPQTAIGKDNVKQLQVKWILNTGHRMEAPPLILGKTGYVQNNGMQVIAIDLDTGLSKWVYDPNIPLVNNALPRSTTSHGLAYENGVIYAPTGPNGTILAIDANKGTKIWESPVVQPNSSAFRISAMPLIRKNYIIPLFVTYQEGIAFFAIFREFAKEINFVDKKTIGTTFFSTLGCVY